MAEEEQKKVDKQESKELDKDENLDIHTDSKEETGTDKNKGEKKKKDKKDKKDKKKKEKPKTIEEKYEDAQEEIQKLKEKYVFLQAEMENSQKIMLKRMDMVRYNSKVNTIKIFLPIVEGFESAIMKLESNEKNGSNGNNPIIPESQKYLEGFKRLQNQFMQILKNNNVKPIDQENVPFDYKVHEAILKMVDDEKPEDTVIQIAQKGWFLDDNILKPAKVVVSKKKEVPKPVEPKEVIVITEENQVEDQKSETTKKEGDNSNNFNNSNNLNNSNNNNNYFV
ncbi:MAG: nucleotide exchange factor GrpE [archaeon]|nr:nucleotide exchange factor GrpE [archaeon]